jgi:hypothetical protein
MSLPALDNLVHIGQLKAEPRNIAEVRRYTVSQCLAHTLNWPASRWRVLDSAHQKRNMAEYEGFFEVDESDIAELCALVTDLAADPACLFGESA